MLDEMLEKEKVLKKKPSKKKLRAYSQPRPSPKRTLMRKKDSRNQSLPGII